MTRRIGTGRAMIIYGAAGFFDLIQIIWFIISLIFTLGAGTLIQTIISAIGYGILIILFALFGVLFWPAKKITKAAKSVSAVAEKANEGGSSLLIFLALLIVDMIPVLGALCPSMLINSYQCIKDSRMADDSKNENNTNTSNPNTIRAKTGGDQNTNLPKPPGAIRGAKNRVS
jgi:ATP/ADP translocase